MVAETNNVNRLWHEKMGHLNYKILSLMKNFEMVHGLPKSFQEKEVCEGCMSRKKHMEKFVKGKSWRAKTPLYLVHSDHMGPLEYPSISGFRYVLTFIDDCIKRILVYFLKQKNEVFNKFKEFNPFVEKQSGKYIKILRIDIGK